MVEAESCAKKAAENLEAMSKKADEDLEMARAEAISRDSRIANLEHHLKEIEGN